MNHERRKRLAEAAELLEQAKTIVEECATEENDYYDNMPESLQSGEKGDKAQEAASTLEEAASSIEDILSSIEEAKS